MLKQVNKMKTMLSISVNTLSLTTQLIFTLTRSLLGYYSHVRLYIIIIIFLILRFLGL